MRIKETNLGMGLSRLDVEPMCSCERNLPTHVVDEIMRDIIRRKKNACGCDDIRNAWGRCANVRNDVRNPWVKDTVCCGRREPDGIDVHVDRPLRENFRTHWQWADAMAKYRTLERVAKDCDWPCKEPMKGVAERPWRSLVNHPKKVTVVTTVDVDDFDWLDDDWGF